MKISSYDVQQKATSAFSRVERSEVSVQTFNVGTQQGSEQGLQTGNQNSFLLLSLSDQQLSLNETRTEDLFHLSDADKAKIQLLETFISAITGQKFKFQQVVKSDDKAKDNSDFKNPIKLDPKWWQRYKNGKVHGSGQRANQPHVDHAPLDVVPSQSSGQGEGGFGARITTLHTVSESEQMRFSSQGVVKTSDGKEIAFNLNLEMSRSYTESTSTLLEIGAKMQDPLVINFDGKGIAFGEDSLKLDITMDGTPDQFKNLASGSGFLALDKNGNGTIDDGSELFGPQTGSGFGELSNYDTDGNGWIDEGDEMFSSLKIWTVSPAGEQTLIGLKEADVGAIYLGKVASKYQMKNGSDLLASIRESSVYLKENGGAGSIHEIDLKI
ncbi:hypothetical protein QE109_08455 [Fusibacter bizertensis]|uniref:Uncharacterized protein n=1 Tax=Fusibacter bizertensis TaxID=1488331 RepID=A0ABT6NCS0_9FIRM|nr:hypothetical protein [Fusibacter bizertensis]MDH8678176.1 hypothetical protein [Fusibacter bizertensis]